MTTITRWSNCYEEEEAILFWA